VAVEKVSIDQKKRKQQHFLGIKKMWIIDGSCWMSQNAMEPVSVRVSPCVQRVPGPMQAVVLSEAKCFTANQPS